MKLEEEIDKLITLISKKNLLIDKLEKINEAISSNNNEIDLQKHLILNSKQDLTSSIWNIEISEEIDVKIKDVYQIPAQYLYWTVDGKISDSVKKQLVRLVAGKLTFRPIVNEEFVKRDYKENNFIPKGCEITKTKTITIT